MSNVAFYVTAGLFLTGGVVWFAIGIAALVAAGRGLGCLARWAASPRRSSAPTHKREDHPRV